MYEKMFFIGGFHRSGSMLLASILCQNENIHIEGKSALCSVMLDAKISVEKNEEFLVSNNKDNFKQEYLSEIPKIYYKNNTRKIVIDKNPWWTSTENMSLIYNYIDKNFKMIVLYRNPIEIIKSFVRVYKKNNLYLDSSIINNFPELIENYNDFVYLLKNKTENFLFVDYQDLIDNTQKKINDIYCFLNIEKYNHNFNNIEKYYLLSDSFYNLNGLYEVGKTIEKRKYEIILDQETYDTCKNMNKKIISYKKAGLC